MLSTQFPWSYPTHSLVHTILDLRYTLVVLTMFLVASVLGPVLWYLWIHAGSANANFFFAMTLVYCLAQVGCYGIDVCICLEHLLRLGHSWIPLP